MIAHRSAASFCLGRASAPRHGNSAWPIVRKISRSRSAAACPRRCGRAEIGARDVIAYLREHPDFLDRHPDALRLLRAPATRDRRRRARFPAFHAGAVARRSDPRAGRAEEPDRDEPRQSGEPVPGAQGGAGDAARSELRAPAADRHDRSRRADRCRHRHPRRRELGVAHAAPSGAGHSSVAVGHRRPAARPRPRRAAVHRHPRRPGAVRRRRRPRPLAGAAAALLQPLGAGRADVHRHPHGRTLSSPASAPSC